MAIRILIIDDNAEYRALLDHHITTRWPDADVTPYDPMQSGQLPDDFSGAGNDVVILAETVGGGDGLSWLRRFASVPKFPPVVFLGTGDEQQVVQAVKCGAEDYVSKTHLNHRRIVSAIDRAIGSSPDRSMGSGVFRGLADAGVPALRHYILEQRLAHSAAVSVYLTRRKDTNERRVLKVFHQVPDSAAGEAAFDRFLQEYEVVAALDHPNIVKIHDLGVADDHAYIAMEYCESGSLKRRIAEGMSPEQSVEMMRTIAAALAVLHESGVFHRDLKPTNVMFRRDQTLALIDFGLAKQARLQSAISDQGDIFGTPYYMSPEQGHGGQVDARADIYSLGIIFYEMLTGQKPYDGDTPMAVVIQHAQAPIPRLAEDLESFQPLVDRLMAKNPDHRIQTARELLEVDDTVVPVTA